MIELNKNINILLEETLEKKVGIQMQVSLAN